MNIYTVRQATEGLARFMNTQDPETRNRGVAISYDCRHYSPEFAMEAAKTLAKHGIKSYVFESLRPTPELSFAVRYLKTFTGIMITASHIQQIIMDIKYMVKTADKCHHKMQMQ